MQGFSGMGENAIIVRGHVSHYYFQNEETMKVSTNFLKRKKTNNNNYILEKTTSISEKSHLKNSLRVVRVSINKMLQC